MSKSQEASTTSEPSHSEAFQAIGEFFCAFSALERALDISVKVVLKIEDDQAVLVCLALNDFARKANLVFSAIQSIDKKLDGSDIPREWKQEAIDTMKRVLGINNPGRVQMAHGFLETRDDGSISVSYPRLEYGKITGTPKLLTGPELKAKIESVRELTGKLEEIQAYLSTVKIVTISGGLSLDLSSTPLVLSSSTSISSSD
jgi:hypothetical protein